NYRSTPPIYTLSLHDALPILSKRELRQLKLNTASLDITAKFSTRWHQRRHHIRYQADGSYFRIWVADDRLPGVEIELESRSKGRSEEHTSELQSRGHLVCRLL